MSGKRYDRVVLPVDPYSGDIESIQDAVDPEGRGYTSPRSPTNLKYARSHAELAGRKSPPLSEGVSFKEALETEDYECWE